MTLQAYRAMLLEGGDSNGRHLRGLKPAFEHACGRGRAASVERRGRPPLRILESSFVRHSRGSNNRAESAYMPSLCGAQDSAPEDAGWAHAAQALEALL